MINKWCGRVKPPSPATAARGLDYFDMFDMEGLQVMRLSWNEIRAVEVLLTKDENA